MKEKQKNSLEVFENAPIGQAVMKNSIPAMLAMLMVLIYNLADTFFIGQTKNALMVASVSLVTPAFLLFMALGTVFGIGGTSVISRAMGEGPVHVHIVLKFLHLIGQLILLHGNLRITKEVLLLRQLGLSVQDLQI